MKKQNQKNYLRAQELRLAKARGQRKVILHENFLGRGYDGKANL